MSTLSCLHGQTVIIPQFCKSFSLFLECDPGCGFYERYVSVKVWNVNTSSYWSEKKVELLKKLASAVAVSILCDECSNVHTALEPQEAHS